jgi:hypothetical protein
MMKIEFEAPEFDVEPRMVVNYEPVPEMALRPGWVEAGEWGRVVCRRRLLGHLKSADLGECIIAESLIHFDRH